MALPRPDASTDPGLLPPQAVQEEILIPGSFVKLTYLSTRTPGYKSLLRVILTPSVIPAGLAKVHVVAEVEGRLFQKWFPAAPGLVYVLAWNKTDIYGQKVTGLTEAIGMSLVPLSAPLRWNMASRRAIDFL